MFYVICEAMVCQGRATREAAEALLADIKDCCPHEHVIVRSESKPVLVPSDEADQLEPEVWEAELV